MTTNTSTKRFDETSQVDADSNNYSFGYIPKLLVPFISVGACQGACRGGASPKVDILKLACYMH